MFITKYKRFVRLQVVYQMDCHGRIQQHFLETGRNFESGNPPKHGYVASEYYFYIISAYKYKTKTSFYNTY